MTTAKFIRTLGSAALVGWAAVLVTRGLMDHAIYFLLLAIWLKMD